jgi:hypothetical protein
MFDYPKSYIWARNERMRAMPTIIPERKTAKLNATRNQMSSVTVTTYSSFQSGKKEIFCSVLLRYLEIITIFFERYLPISTNEDIVLSILENM